MRGVDLPAKARAVSRALGVPVTLELGPPPAFRTFCPKLERTFEVRYRLASQAERALKMLHDDVYWARGATVYQLQFGKCAMCGRRMMPGQYEIDHIKSRGAHGRDDRIENLRALDSECHRRRHGG